MTRARVTAQQLTRPPKSARLMRGTVSAVSPLTVQIAGGGAVGGIPIPGAVYTVGAAVLVLVQEPGVGPVYPIPGTTSLPASLLPPIPTASFGSLPIITSLDTAPDGYAFLGSGQTPFGDGALLVETFTATVNGTPWRLQAVISEQNGGQRSRSSWAGVWGAWSRSTAAATGTVTYPGTLGDWGGAPTVLTRLGPLVSLKLQINVGATPPAYGSSIATIPAGFRPTASAWVRAVHFNNGWGQSADLELRVDGTVILAATTATLAAGHGIFLSTTYTAP